MDRLDKQIILGVLLCFLLVVGLLLEDLGVISFPFLSKNQSSNQTLGIVTKKSKTLERRGKDQFAWDDIDANDKLFAYDSVLTLDKSTAVLKMDNDLNLNLDENSLVAILPPEDQLNALNLILKSGSYTVALRQGQQIKVNKVVFEGKENSSLSFKRGSKDEVQVSVVSGAVKMTNSGAQSATGEAKAGQAVIIESEQGVAKLETVAVTPAPMPAPAPVPIAAKQAPAPVKHSQRKLAHVAPVKHAAPVKKENKITVQKAAIQTDGAQSEDTAHRPDPEAMSQDLSEIGN